MKTAEQIAADCHMNEHESNLLAEIMGDHKNGITEEIIGALYRRIEKLEEKVDELWVSECEDIFLVSQTRDSGRWNKLVKSQERWWYDEGMAQGWLDAQEDWFKESNKVFKVRVFLKDIQRTSP